MVQRRGVRNNSFIIHFHRISGEKKYDEEGKENGVAQTGLDLNSTSLGCEEYHLDSTAKPHKLCYLVY